MSAKKSPQPKYIIQSSPYEKLTSPFRKNQTKAPYPKQFIYYNRNMKMRSLVITNPTTEVDIPSTIEAEDALDIYQNVLNEAACQIQQAFRKSKYFRKARKSKKVEEDKPQ